MCDNCEDGRLGRFEGMTVYCNCIKGASAELSDMSGRLQMMAAVLARLDAMDKLGKLTPRQRAHRDAVASGFAIMTAQHDDLERRWTALRVA